MNTSGTLESAEDQVAERLEAFESAAELFASAEGAAWKEWALFQVRQYVRESANFVNTLDNNELANMKLEIETFVATQEGHIAAAVYEQLDSSRESRLSLIVSQSVRAGAKYVISRENEKFGAELVRLGLAKGKMLPWYAPSGHSDSGNPHIDNISSSGQERAVAGCAKDLYSAVQERDRLLKHSQGDEALDAWDRAK